MTDWSCSSCDWWDSFTHNDQPKYYCPECGDRVDPRPDVATIADAETLTDKL